MSEAEENRVAILFNNITERRQAELKLQGLFQQMPGFVAVLAGPDHVFEYVNDAYIEISGPRDFLGRNVREVFPDLQGQGFYELLDRVYATGEPFVARAIPIQLAGEGEPRYIDLLYQAIRQDGAVSGVFAGGYDVSERVRAERALQDMNLGLEQAVAERTAALTDALDSLRQESADRQRVEEALRQSQKMEAMGQLTGGVAHDFNNLLMPIIGSLDMLVRRGLGSERERRLIEGALQSAERAKTLVQRLLAFARRQPLRPTAVDVSRLVTEMAELVASTSGPKIEIRIALPDDLPPALADANQLEMAILNLSVNARDAMPDGGRITISARREAGPVSGHPELRSGPYVVVSIADTGIGMDEETLARAVEPFFSTKGIGKGTGLGLSMVHGLASQLGGSLVLHSAPGQGTCVDLWLPVSPDPVGLDDSATRNRAPAKSIGTALLVDDEELVRITTAHMLMDLGYEVLEASSAEEAIALLEQGNPLDLLVTDHLMPGVNGAEFARRVMASRPGIQVLVVTGFAEDEGLPSELPRLAKPFRSAELAQALAGLGAVGEG